MQVADLKPFSTGVSIWTLTCSWFPFRIGEEHTISVPSFKVIKGQSIKALFSDDIISCHSVHFHLFRWVTSALLIVSPEPLCGQPTSIAQACWFSPGGFAVRLWGSPKLWGTVSFDHFWLRITCLSTVCICPKLDILNGVSLSDLIWTYVVTGAYCLVQGRVWRFYQRWKFSCDPLSSVVNLTTEVGNHMWIVSVCCQQWSVWPPLREELRRYVKQRCTICVVSSKSAATTPIPRPTPL